MAHPTSWNSRCDRLSTSFVMWNWAPLNPLHICMTVHIAMMEHYRALHSIAPKPSHAEVMGATGNDICPGKQAKISWSWGGPSTPPTSMVLNDPRPWIQTKSWAHIHISQRISWAIWTRGIHVDNSVWPCQLMSSNGTGFNVTSWSMLKHDSSREYTMSCCFWLWLVFSETSCFGGAVGLWFRGKLSSAHHILLLDVLADKEKAKQ